MKQTLLEELKIEQEIYHSLYVMNKNIFDEIKADVFKLAVTKLEKDGIIETYRFFKAKQIKPEEAGSRIGDNLANAYGLVVGKLWKHYKNSTQGVSNWAMSAIEEAQQ